MAYQPFFRLRSDDEYGGARHFVSSAAVKACGNSRTSNTLAYTPDGVSWLADSQTGIPVSGAPLVGET
jgi:hypothetical protein